jgi:hypothetical protein
MKPLTLKFKFSNNCQLGVMRLDRLSDRSDLDSPQLSHQSHRCPSEAPRVTPSPSTPPPTEFLLNSAQSPSIGLGSLPPPPKNTPEKKPPLACLFCRGRKIACGAPVPGSTKKTCKSVVSLIIFSHCRLMKISLANAGSGALHATTPRRVGGE